LEKDDYDLSTSVNGNRWNKRRDAARMNNGNIEGSWPGQDEAHLGNPLGTSPQLLTQDTLDVFLEGSFHVLLGVFKAATTNDDH
jgi:hypothetical protein